MDSSALPVSLNVKSYVVTNGAEVDCFQMSREPAVISKGLAIQLKFRFSHAFAHSQPGFTEIGEAPLALGLRNI
jgi:hypothetical protein